MMLDIVHVFIFSNDCFDDETRIQKCASELKARLDCLNLDLKNMVLNHLTAAVDNVLGGVRYFRVQHDGPRLREITEQAPLFTRYHTNYVVSFDNVWRRT